MVYVFLADGFEEIEAIAPIDIMRRAGINVKTVGVGGKDIKGSHGIMISSDIEIKDIEDDAEMIILPGGTGASNLEKSAEVQNAIDKAVEKGAFIGAICAAPAILGRKGLLKGKKAVCYPGFESDLLGAMVENSQVCRDGRIITGNGPGAAFAFGLTLAECLSGNAQKVKSGMLIA